MGFSLFDSQPDYLSDVLRFVAAGFFAEGVLVETFFAAGFFTAGFLAATFLTAAFFVPLSETAFVDFLRATFSVTVTGSSEMAEEAIKARADVLRTLFAAFLTLYSSSQPSAQAN